MNTTAPENARPIQGLMVRPTPESGARGDDYRAYVWGTLGAVIAYAESARLMATIADDDALAYHLDGAAGALRLAQDVAGDLRKARLVALAKRAKAIRETSEEAANA